MISPPDILTIDVEEWFHGHNYLEFVPPEAWDRQESRVQRNTDLCLDLLAGPGIKATFFGKTAFTYAAPASFALKTGCSVLPAYLEPLPQFRRYRLVIEAPFPLIRTGDQEQDILANTQQYNDWLEKLVRARPELWFGWLHQRWKIPSTSADDPAIIR